MVKKPSLIQSLPDEPARALRTGLFQHFCGVAMTSSSLAFPCTQCGLCCQKVGMAEQTRALDRGDGTCRHYNATNKGCGIYNERPDICRVDRQYQLHYRQAYSWDRFVALNVEVCEALQVQAIAHAAIE
ncbi:YkgJ family cysteine cluster protein [Pseudomonas sp. AIG]